MARRSSVVGLATGLAALGAAAAPAAAAPGPDADTIAVTGEVVAAQSRWTASGRSIVTDATIVGSDGSVTHVNQLGGRVGTLSMVSIPGTRILEAGMAVQLLARPTRAPAGTAALAVELVDVLREPAQGFVRTGPTPGGVYLYWASGCAEVGIADEGTRAIAGDGEFTVFDDVLAEWNDNVASCSYMNVVSTGRLEDQEVGIDHVNVLKFRDVTWCRPGEGNDPPHCYEATTAGVTNVTYIDSPGDERDGEIVDADIEINGVHFAIAMDGVSLGEGCYAELGNTLTHEVGHLLGLEHTCRVPDDPPRIDHEGNPVPLCSETADPAILDATMYNFQDCGEIKKESLEPDDIAAICSIYPIADDPMECKGVGSGGCAAGRGASGPAALALIGLALATTARRRRQSTPGEST